MKNAINNLNSSSSNLKWKWKGIRKYKGQGGVEVAVVGKLTKIMALLYIRY
jgi:hypothetical protein